MDTWSLVKIYKLLNSILKLSKNVQIPHVSSNTIRNSIHSIATILIAADAAVVVALGAMSNIV